MKPGLHWKILTGIVLGLLFGIAFPTNYKITDSTITHFEKLNFPGELIIILQAERRDFSETETEFLKRIKPGLGPEYFEKFKAEIISESKYNPYLSYVGWFGELFLRAMKMIVYPLVLIAVISGMSGLGEEDKLGLLSIKTILYFVIASSLAVLAGLIFVNSFQPGIGFDINAIQSSKNIPTDIQLSESLMNIIPVNIFDALSNGNILSIIFFSVLFGYFITKINDRNRIFLINMFAAMHDTMIKLTSFIIKFTPLGVFALMASFSSELGADYQKLISLVQNLGNFILTILAGLLFHSLVTLPLIMKIGFKLSPWQHYKAMRCALMTTFSTSSPLASLPITMASVQKNCGVSKKVSSFTLPLGTAVNMDGTALYVSVAALFIAQSYGIELSLLDQFIVIAISLLVSIGSSGIQISTFSTLTIILSAIGLPLEGIGLLLTADIILIMFINTVSVWSHSCGAVIIAKSEGEILKV
jgi:proton glutamate symport protein